MYGIKGDHIKEIGLKNNGHVSLEDCSKLSLVDYKIFGDSMQNGKPTPDNPIEVQSVGDRTINLLDIEHFGNIANWQNLSGTYGYYNLTSPFFLITLLAQRSVAKLFSTGKFAPEKVRAYMKKFPEKYANNVGKVGFDLDKAFANDSNFPKEAYYICKNFYTALATVSAGVVSSNIVTPIVRNNMASKMQKNLMASNEHATPKKPLQTQPTFRANYGMRI
jgi:hypothetical protein